MIRSAHDQLCRSAAGLLQSLGRDFRFGVLFWIKYWPFWSLVAGNGTEACYLHVCMGTGRPILPAHSGSPWPISQAYVACPGCRLSCASGPLEPEQILARARALSSELALLFGLLREKSGNSCEQECIRTRKVWEQVKGSGGSGHGAGNLQLRDRKGCEEQSQPCRAWGKPSQITGVCTKFPVDRKPQRPSPA